MMPCPFLFCQKPMVSAPVLAKPQISTEELALWLVSVIVAVLEYVTQFLTTAMLRVYANAPKDGDVIVNPPSVAAVVLGVVVLVRAFTVPSVIAAPPLNVSVTVIWVKP